MSKFLVTMHVFCFNFNFFLKTRSLLFTLHATHRYIQINTKWQKQTKITSICLLFVEDHLLCNLIYIDLLKNTNTSINEPYYIMLITHCIYNNDYTTSNIVKIAITYCLESRLRFGSAWYFNLKRRLRRILRTDIGCLSCNDKYRDIREHNQFYFASRTLNLTIPHYLTFISCH